MAGDEDRRVLACWKKQARYVARAPRGVSPRCGGRPVRQVAGETLTPDIYNNRRRKTGHAACADPNALDLLFDTCMMKNSCRRNLYHKVSWRYREALRFCRRRRRNSDLEAGRLPNRADGELLAH